MLRLIYDALFWAMDLPVGGRKQPLLIILDEAHRFLPDKGEGPANRVVSRIAKEGRKYGVGLMVVTQRPSDVDSAVLSQCGTMIALRVTNQKDRSADRCHNPLDDLGDLSELLPALRTGEALVLGDALQVPSRIESRRRPESPLAKTHRYPQPGSARSDQTQRSTPRRSRTGDGNQPHRSQIERTASDRTRDADGRFLQCRGGRL